MLPYITIFAHRVAMYGVMAALGTALAVLYLRRAEKRFPETAADAELVFIYGLLGMFVGAKLLSLLTVLPELRADLPLLTSDIGAFFRKATPHEKMSHQRLNMI